MSRSNFKRKIYLIIAASSLLFRRWSIRKKLYLGFVSLIFVLTLNLALTTYELSRLGYEDSKLNYLIYLDLIGIMGGFLFIWIITQSLLRPMKRLLNHLQSKSSSESFKLYSNDEMGQLAKAIGHVTSHQKPQKNQPDEKNLILETILQHSLENIFVFNEKGEMLSFSKGLELLLKGHSKDFKGKKLAELFGNFDLNRTLEQINSESFKELFYVQRIAIRSLKGKDTSINCSICKVGNNSQKIYIGILKPIHSSQKIKEKLTKVLTPSFLKIKKPNGS